MNWNNGFSASYYGTVVDVHSWLDTTDDGKPLFDIMGGSISRSVTSLRESADIDCRNRRPKGEQWVRIYLNTRQGGSNEHTALFTGLAVSPQREINGNIEDNALECYSVLKPCEDVLLSRGWYAPAGTSGATLVQSLLRATTPAPVIVQGESPRLMSHIVAENEENHLSMADKILNAMGWRLKILGNGTIVICELAREQSAMFDAIENDSIRPQLKVTDDFYFCPNVFRATSGDVSAEARDESPTSPMSIPNRGREVWASEGSVNLSDSESLGDYARRRLKELQQHAMSVEYTRRYNPDVLVTDIVRLNYPKQDVSGLFVVTSQKITLGFGAETSEEVEQIGY